MKRKLMGIILASIMAVSMIAATGVAAAAEEAAEEKSAEMIQGEKRTPKNGDKWKIGFANGYSGNSWRAMMLASMEQELKNYDDIEFIVVDGQNDVNKQVNDIQNLIAQDVDAIMVVPNSAQACEPVLKEARQMGIAVATFNIPVTDPEAYDVFVGTDQYAKSELYSQWLIDKLGGEGKIVCIGGIPGNDITQACMDALNDKLEGTNIEILQYVDGYWDEATSKQAMTDLLNAYGDEIDGVWCDNSANACGAIKAMLEGGYDLVPMTGDDYNGAAKLYAQYKDEYPNFALGTVAEPTYEGRDSIRQLYAFLNGEEVQRDIYILPDLIADEAVADVALMDLPDSVYCDNDLDEATLKSLVE